MELPVVTMPQAEALTAFQAYRHAVRSAKTATVNSEDAQIARCYKAIADGKKVFNILDAFEQAGFDEKGSPCLAISRADEQQTTLWHPVACDWFEIGPANLMAWGRRSNAAIKGRVFRFPAPSLSSQRDIRMRAIVPNIPPALRPPFKLENYHLLWEPKWERIPRPPGDPALLKHLGGPLYAVLATWDLTPVEQAVLGVTRA